MPGLFRLATVLLCCWTFSLADPARVLFVADSCYATRANKAKGDKANRSQIDKTINLYKSLLQDSLLAENAALGIMRSEYFRIRFATKNEKEKNKLIASAKTLGDTLHARFPKNKEMTSLYATIVSMWGASIGPLKAVKQGVAARVRDLADSAGDYQILGRTHQLLPYIPLILPWPDKERALKYLRLAVKNQSKDPYSYFFLGELYFDRKEYDNAEKIIQQGLDLGVRTDFFLEDKRGRWHLKELLKKVKAKQN